MPSLDSRKRTSEQGLTLDLVAFLKEFADWAVGDRTMLNLQETSEIVKKFGKTENDSGSTEVQIALITERIKYLTPHFTEHKHDHHSKRGMMKLIGKRRRLLKYLQKKNPESYQNVIKELGLRK